MFTARHLVLGALGALIAGGQTDDWILAVSAVAALAIATAAVETGPASLFAIPHWAFRAFSLALRARPDAERPALATAWWRHGEG